MTFYINAPSLMIFSNLLLTITILFYLWKRTNKSKPIRLLMAAFLSNSIFLVLYCILLIFSRRIGIWTIPFQYSAFLISLVFLIQFSYYFPHSEAFKPKEARLALYISCILAAASLLMSLHSVYVMLWGTAEPTSMFLTNALFIAIETSWCLVVLLRRTFRESDAQTLASRLRALFKRGNQKASGTRALALLFIMGMAAVLAVLMRELEVMPNTIANIILNIGITFFLFAFAIIYFNHAPERSSFLAKLVGASLVTMMVFLSTASFLVSPFWDSNYRCQTLPSPNQTIRFHPNQHGTGYDIRTIPSVFDKRFNKNVKLAFPSDADTLVELKFPFPFAGKDRKQFYINKNGAISFESPFFIYALWLNRQPVIAPLFNYMNLDSNSGIFQAEEPGKITITWANLIESRKQQRRTIQLTLYMDGTVEFSYRNLEGCRPRLSGLFSGEGYHHFQDISFKHQLPLSTSATTIFENYSRAYRAYIHDRVLPIGLILVLAAFLILTVFPLYFRGNLVKPIQALLNGIKRVEMGELNTRVPIQFNDEIASLTYSFNHLVETLKEAKEGHKDADVAKAKLLSLNRAILDTADEGILTLDPQGKVLSFNRAAERMFLYEKSQVIGKPAQILLDEIEPGEPMGFLESYRSSVNKSRFGVNKEIRGKRSDGTYFPLEFAINANEIIGDPFYTVVIHNLSHHKRLAMEKVKLEEQLNQSQKLETIGTLAGGIAHDFNNILTPIIGYAEMSLEDVDRNDPMHGHIKNIITSCSRAKKLVKQILSYSRRSQTLFEAVEMYPVIKESIDLLRASIPVTIAFDLHLTPGCGAVLGNRTQLEQVLINLCTNAQHAMQPHGGVLSVFLEPIQVGDQLAAKLPALKKECYVMLRVQDNGKGIDKETKEHIFEPFFTTKPTDQGTGLGLAVVHGIIEKHGATMVVDSEPGKGTTFTIYFPSIPGQDIGTPLAQESVHKGDASILLVDDEEMIVDMYKETLKRAGYQVTAETSSLKAMEIFQANPNDFDIVITDNTMPHLTGINMSSQMLSIRPDLPVIIFTGNSDSISNARCEEVGVKKLLLKPVFSATLHRSIRELTAKPAAQKEPTV